MPTVQTLITEVRRVIHDESATFRWSDAEEIDYCNAGIRQTIVLVPEANTVEIIHDTGATLISRQALPSGGIQFLKAARNYATNGTTPQGTIRYAEKDALDTYAPGWEYDATAKAAGDNFFEHYCHDPKERKIFYLYPAPAAANTKVAIVYSAVPTAHTLVGDTFALGDEYINAIVQYMTYRSLTKEGRHTLPSAYRQELWQNYLLALGLGNKAAKDASPEAVVPPEEG